MLTVRFTIEAMQELYRVPRGPAAQITEMIEYLRLDPYPPTSTAVDEMEGTYQLTIAEYVLEYQVRDDHLRILAVSE